MGLLIEVIYYSLYFLFSNNRIQTHQEINRKIIQN